jgi:hypothetical protein
MEAAGVCRYYAEGNEELMERRKGMWRQGDIYIASVRQIPETAEPRPHCVLAEGEVTGHSHRVAEPTAARLYSDSSTLYLRVTVERATVVHDEHGPITLARGMYRVWRQREYSPEAIRFVRD